MFLTEISDLIVIDEIINESKYTHFLTHCENRFFTETEFISKIYTSKNIARILYRHKKIPIKVFNILQSNHTTKIQLSNGQNISVTLFEGDQYTNNICFHFENGKTTLFYCGHFRNIYGLFKSPLCFDLSKIGIDYLYLDNTRANAEYLSSVNDIGIKLKQIMKVHPNYKLIVSLPNYGYEDLLVNLLLKHQMKIFIGIHQKDILTYLKFDNYLVNTFGEAQLIIRKDVVDMDCIKERYTKKHYITIRIVEFEKEVIPHNFEQMGLYQIHYSPHITQFEIFSIIAFFQPKYLREIYPEFSAIPQFLKEASLVLCSEKQEKHYCDSLSETAMANDMKIESVENKQIPTAIQLPSVNETEKLEFLDLNNNKQSDNIKTTINKFQNPKRGFAKSNEFTKPCPKLVAKNIIKELFDEFVDNENAGDYCIANNPNITKNLHNIKRPIFNCENSEIAKSLIDNDYNFHVTPETIVPIDGGLKFISPTIGPKRLKTIDDKYHIPKDKHRKLLLNSSIKETSGIIPDQKINLNDPKMKTSTINPSNQKNQITCTVKSRNISGISNRPKNRPKKNTISYNIPTNLSITQELKCNSDQKNKKVATPECLNKSATVDYSKQKTFKRSILRQMEYINSDEE